MKEFKVVPHKSYFADNKLRYNVINQKMNCSLYRFKVKYRHTKNSKFKIYSRNFQYNPDNKKDMKKTIQKVIAFLKQNNLT